MNAPAAVVQRQLNAYNARDVEVLLAGTLELVAIYEIRAGLIAEARFITGTKTLAARS